MVTLTFKPTLKDRLFYDKYTHALAFRLPAVHLARGWDHTELDNKIEFRNSGGAYGWRNRPVSAEEASNLHNFIDVVGTLSEHKIMLSFDYAYIYSNSITDLETLANLPYVLNPHPTYAVINRPRDTVLLTDPKYKYRTFFKERYLTENNMASLSKFLLNRKDCFSITEYLEKRLITGGNFYTMSHYFVDHNNMEDLVMLQIVCPGIVRKTMTIQAK